MLPGNADVPTCTLALPNPARAVPGSSQPGRTGAKRLFSLSEHAGAKRLHACLVRHSSLPDVHPRPPPFMYVGGAPLPTKLTPSVHCGDGRPRQYCIVGREEVNAQVADTSNAFFLFYHMVMFKTIECRSTMRTTQYHPVEYLDAQLPRHRNSLRARGGDS